MVCPWYAYSQTMISEVSPLPQMYVSRLHALRRHTDAPWQVLVLRAVLCGTSVSRLFTRSWLTFMHVVGRQDIRIHRPVCLFRDYHSVRQ